MNIIEVGKIYKTLHGEFKVLEFINKDKHYQNYYVLHNNERKILKYIPNKDSQEPCFYVSRIKTLLTMKLDSSYFIKPCDLIEFDELSYGYILDIVDDSYCKLCDFQFLETKFSSLEVLLDACLNITKAFRYIHKRFNMYFQIFDENNFYINPENGDIKIVVEDYTFKMGTNNDLMGRERFSAPEIVTYEDQERNGNTDSYLLSLLIFLLIVNHHPFEGKNYLETEVFNFTNLQKIYGDRAIFIYDKDDDDNNLPSENGAFKEVHSRFESLPEFMKYFFKEEFSFGRNQCNLPRAKDYVIENHLTRLKNCLFKCECGHYYFIDDIGYNVCLNCGKANIFETKIKINKNVLVLKEDDVLYRCLFENCDFDKSFTPIFRVVKNKTNPPVLGLRLLSDYKVKVFPSNNEEIILPINHTVLLKKGTIIKLFKSVIEVL